MRNWAAAGKDMVAQQFFRTFWGLYAVQFRSSIMIHGFRHSSIIVFIF